MQTCETAFECFLQEVYRSPEGYTSRSTNSQWILQVWKNRIPKAIAKPPESLESLQILETLSGFIVQKTLHTPEQLENAQHKKEMLETLKTHHNSKKQRALKK